MGRFRRNGSEHVQAFLSASRQPLTEARRDDYNEQNQNKLPQTHEIRNHAKVAVRVNYSPVDPEKATWVLLLLPLLRFRPS